MNRSAPVAPWAVLPLVVGLWGGALSCGSDQAIPELSTLTQSLVVDCAGSAADFGNLEFALVRVDYLDRPEIVEFAVRPLGGAVSLDCSTGGPAPLVLGPVNRLPLGDAVFSFRFMGNGPCDDGSGRLYEVLEPRVVLCDLVNVQSVPAGCPVTTIPLACVSF